MYKTRREFMVETSAAGIGAAAALALPAAALGRTAAHGKPAKKRVLFLGGTGMLGPHVVRGLLDAGHEVTLFNRGNRPEMFPGIEQILGNRIVTVEPGLAPLRAEIKAGRRWDVIIDTASVHTWVENTAALLKDAAERYVFVSSMSVYADNSVKGIDETGALATMPDEVAEEITTPRYNMAYFGAVKARCESAAKRHFGDKALALRPSLLVGPRDFSHRFTYWPVRVRRGGEVLAPGSPEQRVQFVDVRDLAKFMVKLVGEKHTGVFNVSGPVGPERTMGSTLEACKLVTASDARFTWIDESWLIENGVGPWMQMPLWVPSQGATAGFHYREFERAIEAGLVTRPLEQTIGDTLEWFDGEYLPGFKRAMAERGEGDVTFEFGAGRPGILATDETRLLRAWRESEEG